MISVLIPTYNYNFFALLTELHKQLTIERIPFEVIVIDDFSNIKFEENNILEDLEHVSIFYLKRNIGRSLIRNLLAEKAKFEWMLFLDSDTFPVDNTFINKYIKEIKLANKIKVICGGVNYKPDEPELSHYLRWNFGRQREQLFYSDRIRKPYNSFFSSNFLIHKNIFNHIKFNTSISLYGYEDVVFASELKKKQIEITHIDNAVFHLGIEKNEEYLSKTKVAIVNLIELYRKYLLTKNEVKLLKSYLNIKKFKLDYILRFLYVLLGSKIEKYLSNGKSKLFIFDFYKIIYLCFIAKNH